MNKQLSDEQIDNLMRSLTVSTAFDEAEIDEIVSSPKLWWSVQREIAVQKEAATSPWPPTYNWLRVVSFAIPLVLLAVVVIGLLNFRSTNESTETAGLQQNVALPVSNIATVPATEPAAPSLTKESFSLKNAVIVPTKQRLAVERRTNTKQTSAPTKPRPITTTEELKSDFIALSYAQNPTSGQIVRVKVPSSMKVTLGMVDRVDKPSELVDAEVVVGDDGMTHAIRFIRQ